MIGDTRNYTKTQFGKTCISPRIIDLETSNLDFWKGHTLTYLILSMGDRRDHAGVSETMRALPENQVYIFFWPKGLVFFAPLQTGGQLPNT